MIPGLETVAASAAKPLAQRAAKRLIHRLQGGQLGRLFTELDRTFGAETGMSAAGLAPLLEDFDLVEALHEFADTATFPRDRIVEILAGHLSPLREGQSTAEAAEEVATAMERGMAFAFESDRQALVFELQRLRGDILAGEPSLVEEDPTGDPRERVWNDDFAALHYLNVPRLLMDPAGRAAVVQEPWLEDLASFRTADGLQILRATQLLGVLIRVWEERVVDVESFADIGDLPVGARVAFIANFRTKNMAGRQLTEIELSGDLLRDPHLYAQTPKRRVYLPIDPRWITTSTAHHEFTSGQSWLGGLGILRGVTPQRAVVSPLVLGLPITEANAWFYRAP
ncbi:MAG: hypothetical protein M3540_00390 [Actinomycetota bacterium]|nr:hypothetical protein [Actinomycetota bacterium]